jgi:hypothetical protein
MNKKILRNIFAIFIGFLVVVILSNGTDYILERFGVFEFGPIFDTKILLILLAYRTVYNFLGFWVCIKLSKENANKNLLVMFILGVVLGTAGAVAMKDFGPAWYGGGIVIFSVPAYILAKKLFIK